MSPVTIPALTTIVDRQFKEDGGVSVDQIMQACHWKAHNTITKFFLKDLTWSDIDNNMYLGPKVAAQQVLDPSPQTAHPRKEKKGGGGHIRCSQVFRSLIPGSKYLVISSGCYGKVLYLLLLYLIV